MPVLAVKFASVNFCRSTICGLATISTLMVLPSVAGFLVGPASAPADPDPAADPAADPVAEAAPEAGELTANPFEVEPAVVPPPAAAVELSDSSELLPQAAVVSSTARPSAVARRQGRTGMGWSFPVVVGRRGALNPAGGAGVVGRVGAGRCGERSDADDGRTERRVTVGLVGRDERVGDENFEVTDFGEPAEAGHAELCVDADEHSATGDGHCGLLYCSDCRVRSGQSA